MPERFDVIVVGGGPAGSASATLLADRGHRVLLLDAARFPRRKACAEYISPGGADIVRSLGAVDVLNLLDTDAPRSGRWLDGMELRAPSGACHLVSYRDRAGQPRQGLSIAREQLDTALVEIARRRGVEVREGCRVHGLLYERSSESPRSRRHSGAAVPAVTVAGVNLAGGETIWARVVIGADGLHSVVARGVTTSLPRRWPRRLGLVAHLRGVEWPERHGQMWVGRRGYVGVAPLDGDGLLSVGVVRQLVARPAARRSSVGAAPPTGANRTATALFDNTLRDFPELAHRLAGAERMGGVIGVGPLARRVRATAGRGYVLVGDAACFFDPFTGEGIFRALRGAQLAAAYVDRVLDSGVESPPSYERARREAFAAKERLTAIIQVFVQSAPLMELAIRRLNERPRVAQQLGNVLGDLEPARLRLVWDLLAP